MAMIMDQARTEGYIKGVLTGIHENGVNMLQYADDTIFLLQDDMDSAHNLKYILCLFQHMSGLKINFLKSEVLCVEGTILSFKSMLICLGAR